MQAFRIPMILVAVAVAYLLFLRSQPKAGDLSVDLAGSKQPAARATPGASPRTEYKAALDRAHAAADQVKAQHAEADSF